VLAVCAVSGLVQGRRAPDVWQEGSGEKLSSGERESTKLRAANNSLTPLNLRDRTRRGFVAEITRRPSVHYWLASAAVLLDARAETETCPVRGAASETAQGRQKLARSGQHQNPQA
jgi:uncharacterized membrane protein